MYVLKNHVAGAAIAACLCFSIQASADTLPLKKLADDSERYYWWYHQVQTDEVLANMQKVVGEPAVPFAADSKEPVKIAVIYPSQDVSDFWLRSYLAMEARFKEMGLKFEATQFASNMGDFLLQSTYSG